MNGLSGRTAVVTGAASGIGRAVAEALGSQGARVAVLDIDADGAQKTVDLVHGTGGLAAAFEVDITDPAAVRLTASAVAESLGPPTVVVNNAGWDVIQRFIDTEFSFWRKLVDINYLGPVTITHSFLAGMIDAGGGRVVNIASDAGRVGSTGETVYAGTKAGVIGFTKSLAREMARHGITVNCVCPGPTDTPLFQRQPEKMREALVRAIPFRRVARPEEIAYAVSFFASEGAGYITGQVLSVSGGLTMAG